MFGKKTSVFYSPLRAWGELTHLGSTDVWARAPLTLTEQPSNMLCQAVSQCVAPTPSAVVGSSGSAEGGVTAGGNEPQDM